MNSLRSLNFRTTTLRQPSAANLLQSNNKTSLFTRKCTPFQLSIRSSSIQQASSPPPKNPVAQPVTHSQSAMETKSRYFYNQGKSLIEQQKFKEAQTPFISGLMLASQLNNKQLAGEISVLLGHSFTQIGNHKQAIPHYTQATNLLAQAKQRGIAYSYLAEAYARNDQKTEAIESCKKSLDQLVAAKEDSLAASAKVNLAGYLQLDGKFSEAKPFCEQALSYFESEVGKYNPITKNCYVNLCTILKGLGQEEEIKQVQEKWKLQADTATQVVQQQAMQAFQKQNDLKVLEKQWEELKIKPLDPVGLFVPAEIAKKEEELFSTVWKNQL